MTVVCGSTPPAFEVRAMITSSETVQSETYHWVRPDGTATASSIISLEAGGTSSSSTTFSPASDNFSGDETLVFTSPAQGTWSLPLSLACATSTAPPSDLTMHFPASSSGNEINVTLNEPFSATFTETGGTAPYTWTAVGLPPGLTINASTGTVSGTATSAAAGNYTDITVRDSGNPAQQITMEYIFNCVLP